MAPQIPRGQHGADHRWVLEATASVGKGSEACCWMIGGIDGPRPEEAHRIFQTMCTHVEGETPENVSNKGIFFTPLAI